MSADKNKNGKRPEGALNREPPTIEARILDAQTYAPEAVDPAMSHGTPPDKSAGGVDLHGLDAGFQDPPAQDPSMQDPSMQDPLMQDPSMQDPSMQDPSRHDPLADEPPTPAASDSAHRGKMKIAPLVFAVLGGAAIALGGLWFVRGNDDAMARIADMQRQAEASAATVEARLKAADAGMQAAIDKKARDIEVRLAATQTMLDSQRQIIAALEQRVAGEEAKSASTGDAPQAVPLVSSPAAEIPAKPETAPARDAVLVAGLDEVSGKLAEMAGHVAQTDKTLATLAAATPQADPRLLAIEAKLAPLETAIAALPARLAPVESGLAAIAPRLAPLEAAVAALPERLAPVEAGLAAIGPRLAPLEAAQAAPKSQSRATETRSEGPGAANNAAAVAVVAQSMLTALDRGVPFVSEIAALDTLAVDPANLAPLKAVAATGAPLPALAAQIKSLSAAILKPVVADPEKQQSWAERIGSSAASLVNVSHKGDVSGDDAAGLLAQIDAAMAKGKSDAALAAWEKLPTAAKAASQDWQQMLVARKAAVEAASSILAGAIAGLGTKKP